MEYKRAVDNAKLLPDQKFNIPFNNEQIHVQLRLLQHYMRGLESLLLCTKRCFLSANNIKSRILRWIDFR